MDAGQSGKNRNGMSVERGALYGKRPAKKKSAAMQFTTAEFKLENEMHTVWVALNTPSGTVPSEGIQMIRERRQWPWRVIARRFREARNAGVPASQLDEVIHVLRQYRERLYATPAHHDKSA